MRLVIDCFKLVKGAGKSIGIYNLTVNLVRELAKNNTQGRHELIILGNAYNRKDFELPEAEFIEIKKNPLSRLTCILWELFGVSVKCKRLKADKVLFPRGFSSMLHLTRESIIIHDMIPFYYKEHYPDYFNKLENFYIMWRLKASIHSADQVITISQASKNDIIKYAKRDRDSIIVIHNGCNAIEKREYPPCREEYILAVTSSLPHKNAEGIVKSYAEYVKNESSPLPLKIIGIDSIEKYNLPKQTADNIQCIKYIQEDKTLHRMIHDARVFLFLSLVEGFGFPPIEAMQLDTPVICSDRSSLPEIVGDAAILADPENYSEVARKISDVLSGKADTEALIQKGRENLERFSWTGTGQKYIRVLEQL